MFFEVDFFKIGSIAFADFCGEKFSYVSTGVCNFYSTSVDFIWWSASDLLIDFYISGVQCVFKCILPAGSPL